MPCDAAFRIIARRHLKELDENHRETCNGDPTALHQMRIALTHLRSDILFFSAMLDDDVSAKVKADLKWLNTELGAVRDLDVAVERLGALNGKWPAQARREWEKRRTEGHERLTRALCSARYRSLIGEISSWIEGGLWSVDKGRRAQDGRSRPIGDYTLEKLARWERQLLKKSRKLDGMGAKKRHRLRLLNKRLTYSLESFADLFSDKRFSRQAAALKHLRKAQRSLGELNDAAQGEALARELPHLSNVPPLPSLEPKRRKHLLKAAAGAYRKLSALS